MNEKNFEYLKDQLKYTGFGEGLQSQLKENLQRQSPEFTLQHQASFGKDEATASLHFKRSATTDMYFFNSYLVSLKKGEPAEKMNQTFYVGRGNNITLKEAYNLMNGRAVNKDLSTKEGKIYNAWVQLDFKQTDAVGNFKTKQFHSNYGFDLEKQLSSLPIKELGNIQDKQRLIESLQKGNRQVATFVENGAEQKRYIEANPQFKSVNVYDDNQQRLRQGKSQQVQQAKEVGQAKSEGLDVASESSGKKARKSKEIFIGQ